MFSVQTETGSEIQRAADRSCDAFTVTSLTWDKRRPKTFKSNFLSVDSKKTSRLDEVQSREERRDMNAASASQHTGCSSEHRGAFWDTE